MRLILAIYNSKIFTGTVFVLGLVVFTTYVFKFHLKGGLTFVSIILGFILLLIISGIIWQIWLDLLRSYFKRKLKHSSYKYILLHSGREAWDKIIQEDIEPMLGARALVIRNNKDTKPWATKWIPIAFSINKPGLLIIQSQKRFDLWKAVRKAAYGHPTKLSNLKFKIQKEINKSH